MKPDHPIHPLSGIFVALMAAMILSPTAFSADKKPAPISLMSLMQEVLNSNPELKYYETEIDAAKGGHKQAGIWKNPVLSSDIAGDRTRSGGVVSDGLVWGFSLVQTFEYKGRIPLRKAIANRDIELAGLGLRQFTAALSARARSLGYKLIVNHQKAAAATEVADRLQELRNALVQRDPAGVAPLLELRIVEASLVTFRRQAIEANQALQKALFDINLLRGKPLDSPLELSHITLSFPKVPAVDSLLASARSGNFEIKMRKVELEQQGFKLSLSENQRWPSVTAGPYFAQDQSAGRETIAGIGVSLPLPLWNRNAGNIDTAKARSKQAEVSLYLVQLRVEQAVMETYLAFQLNNKEMGIWQKNSIAKFQEAADLGDRHYRLGALPIATYIELQREYLSALNSILDVQVEALDSLLQLRVLTQLNLGAAPVSKGKTKK